MMGLAWSRTVRSCLAKTRFRTLAQAQERQPAAEADAGQALAIYLCATCNGLHFRPLRGAA